MLELGGIEVKREFQKAFVRQYYAFLSTNSELAYVKDTQQSFGRLIQSMYAASSKGMVYLFIFF